MMTRRTALALLASTPLLRAELIEGNLLSAVEHVTDQSRKNARVPGLSMAIGKEGRVIWERGFGSADLEHFVPARPDTRYRTASIAKPMTAVAAMTLVEQGKLDIDAPIQRYVPTFPEKRWPITARHIMGHLSGIRNYRDNEFASTVRYDDLESALDVFRDDPLLFQPGERYSYTTFGFNLLGRAVEGASGKRFVEYLSEAVLRPAGMWLTRTDDARDIVANRSRGYVIDDANVLRNCDLADTSVKIPGGGLLSTAGDLVRFAMALHDGRLLKAATVEEMFTPQRTLDGKPSQAGLSWMIGQVGNRKMVFHSGGQQGTTTRLILLPDSGLSLAVMANLEDFSGLSGLVDTVLGVLTKK